MYAQFIAINANFRFKLKNRGVNDPELGFRRSYFVENLAYTHHVSENTHEEEARCILQNGSQSSDSGFRSQVVEANSTWLTKRTHAEVRTTSRLGLSRRSVCAIVLSF